MAELVADCLENAGIILNGEPSNVASVLLPELIDGNTGKPMEGIRLGMHTDTILDTLRVLRGLNLPDLKIEGRVITSEQLRFLRSHPVFCFYMRGRWTRFVETRNNPEITALVLPQNLNLEADEVARLAALTFSPRSLMDEIGHQVGFYSVQDILEHWRIGSVADFESLFGGCNEFRIGSDTMTRFELLNLAVEISQRLRQIDSNQGQVPISPYPLISSILAKTATIYQIQSLYKSMPTDDLPLNNNFKTFKIISTSKITPKIKKFDNFNLIKPIINNGK